MVVHGNCQNFLGLCLIYYILVKNVADLSRRRQLAFFIVRIFLLDFFANDIVAQVDTLIADKYGRARNKFTYFMLTLPAKGTVQQFTLIIFGFITGHLSAPQLQILRLRCRHLLQFTRPGI